MANLSNFAENALLDHSLGVSAYTPAATVYLALFSAFTEGGTQTELTGDSYARQAVTFGAASSRSVAMSGTESFVMTASKTSSHVAVMDASTSGNVLAWGAFARTGTQIDVSSLTLTFGAGDLSDYAANAALDLMFRNQAWSSPTPQVGVLSAYTNDTTFTEIDDGFSSTRTEASFGSASAGASTNDAAISLPAASSGYTTSHHALFDNATIGMGNLLWRKAKVDTVAASTRLRWAVGEFDVAVN